MYQCNILKSYFIGLCQGCVLKTTVLGWFAAGVNTVDNLSELHIDLQYDNYFVLFHNSIKWFYFFYMKAEIWSHILIFFKNDQLSIIVLFVA